MRAIFLPELVGSNFDVYRVWCRRYLVGCLLTRCLVVGIFCMYAKNDNVSRFVVHHM